MSEGCKNCGHLVGYHHMWVNSEDQMFCTAGKNGGECDCPGYIYDDGYETPQTGPISRALKLKEG